MSLSFSYPTHPFSSTPSLALDTLLAALEHDLAIRAPEARSTKRWRVCRYIVMRLFDTSRGSLRNAELKLAQISIATKLKISLRWVHELAHRLTELGWLEMSSEKMADGTNSSTVWRIGPMIQRLLVALRKSKQRKTSTKTDTHSRWYFSPPSREKKILELRAKENEPPKPHILAKFPLLKEWLIRGNQ